MGSSITVLTGATGFIGRHLAAEIARRPGDEVLCVSRQSGRVHVHGVRELVADLGERGWTNKLPRRADLAIHLAQSSRYREFPDGALDVCAVNVAATVELASWARRAGVRRLVFSSTGSVYGHTDCPVGEDGGTCPRGMYAASKLAAEALLCPYAEFFEVVVARLFGVYGPGQTGMLFAQVINKVLAEEEIELQGGTGVRLNPLYIDDCVAILAQLCKVKMPSTYEIFNVGGDEIVDLARVVREVETLTGKRAQVRCTPQTPVSLTGSITKLRSVVHGVGATVLAEGLGKTVSERVART